MELEHQMLVSEYAQNVINNRPLKYGTRQSYIKIIKSLGIWETEISDLNCALIFDKVDQMRSHNVKKNVYICLRSVFKDLGIFNELPILEAAWLAVNRRVCIGVNTTRGFNLRKVIKNVFHILICRIEGVDPFAVVEIGTIDQLLFGN